MWIVENNDGIYKVCATKEIALREVLRMLKDFYKEYPNDNQELKDYRELMEDYFSLCKDGFYVDEFCWVYKAEFIGE